MLRHLLMVLVVAAAVILPPGRAHASSTYFATDMYHNTGRYESYCRYSSNTVSACWRAAQAEHQPPQHVVFGPYATNIPAGDNIAEYTMGFPAGSGLMATVDVNDATTHTVLASRDVQYSEFVAGKSNKVKLPFVNAHPGNLLEFRVKWPGVGTIDVFHIVVVGSADVIASYAMSSVPHQRGRADGQDWSVNGVMDTAGYMTYGPYAQLPKAHKMTALFKLMVDNNTYDNSPAATIEVRDYDSGQLLATRTITRLEFSAPNVYNYFPLQFYEDGWIPQLTGRLEFRVYWQAKVGLKQTTLVVHDWGVGSDPLF